MLLRNVPVLQEVWVEWRAKSFEPLSQKIPDLQEEVAFIVGQDGQGKLRATLKIAAKASWRKRRLDRMEKALSDAEQLMQTTLLAWIL